MQLAGAMMHLQNYLVKMLFPKFMIFLNVTYHKILNLVWFSLFRVVNLIMSIYITDRYSYLNERFLLRSIRNRQIEDEKSRKFKNFVIQIKISYTHNITSLIIKWRLTKFFSAVVEGSTQDFNQAELCTYLYIKLVHSHMKPVPLLDISNDGCRI